MLELILVLAEEKTERNNKNVNLINQIKTRIMLSLNSDSFLSAYSSELKFPVFSTLIENSQRAPNEHRLIN